MQSSTPKQNKPVAKIILLLVFTILLNPFQIFSQQKKIPFKSTTDITDGQVKGKSLNGKKGISGNFKNAVKGGSVLFLTIPDDPSGGGGGSGGGVCTSRPDEPVVTVNQPACNSATGTVSVVSPISSDITYIILQEGVESQINSTNTTISLNAGNTYYIYSRSISNGCASATPATVVLSSTISTAWYRDSDGDGFGDPNNSVMACSQPAGYVANASDCNDGSTLNQSIIYVNKNATGTNNGFSWVNAFTNLQEALAYSCGTITQLWVAKGTYYPDEGAGITDNSFASSFKLKNGIAVYGGFAGTETNLASRNWALNVTTLSGDLAQNDGADFSNYTDNAWHVVFNGGFIDATAILDGFTITAGQTSDRDEVNKFGGGMYNFNSSPTITNCTFTKNLGFLASGMYNVGSNPVITNCNFQDNKALADGAGLGNSSCSPVFTNCNFSGNVAAEKGGGVFSFNSSPRFINCNFSGNKAKDGGGMFNLNASSVLINNRFYKNQAVRYGNAIFNSGGTPSITNSTFFSNYNFTAGGVLIFNTNNSTLAVTNSILWLNGTLVDFYNDPGSSSSVTYTISKEAGEGNLQFANPRFVNELVGDLRLSGNSPARNVGKDAANFEPLDLDGNPRKVGIIDMGAYEYACLTPSEWVLDKDNDAYYAGSVITACTTPGEGYVIKGDKKAGDCKDDDNTINPGAREVCDNIDNDCDGRIDEELQYSVYIDEDGDGIGSGRLQFYTCTTPVGYSRRGDDCAPNDPTRYYYDNFYVDNDGDGYTVGPRLLICYGSQALTGYSSTSRGEDCNDQDAALPKIFYADVDGDGYTTGETLVCNLLPPANYRTEPSAILDCNDGDALVHSPKLYWPDEDGDGFGYDIRIYDSRFVEQCWSIEILYSPYYRVYLSGNEFPFCSPYPEPDKLPKFFCTLTPPLGWSVNADDCNDNDPTIKPVNWIIDIDQDGYYPGTPVLSCLSPGPGYIIKTTQLPGDCNDNISTINTNKTWYKDGDDDKYTDGIVKRQCFRPVGYKLEAELISFELEDCDDGAASINPGATEICDGIDNNCNSTIDEGLTTTFYQDFDGDGFGNLAVTTKACSVPSGYVTNSTDCNDNNRSVYQSESLFLDQDGDGYIDDVAPVNVCYGQTIPAGYTKISSIVDNCPSVSNPNQTNTDGDAKGDACDTDDDNDGVLDANDCAPLDATKWRSAVAYLDVDADGYTTSQATICYGSLLPTNYILASLGNDNCPAVSNPNQTNTDGDTEGDACDADDDNDLALDANDCAPLDATKWRSAVAYLDVDGDGYTTSQATICYGSSLPTNYILVSLGNDNCPAVSNPDQTNTDGDAQGDACDTDDDNDGTPDADDCAPLDVNKWRSAVAYLDVDGDGYTTSQATFCYGSVLPTNYILASLGNDNCPAVSNPDQTNTDGDAQGDACDTDDDNDGVLDANDCAPLVATKWRSAVAFIDSDGDGFTAGTLTVCYGASLPLGFSLQSRGTDCNDNTITLTLPIPYYQDLDGDGFGNPARTLSVCSLTAPSGFVANNTDCADNNASVNPAAVEVCGNRIDDNCNGFIDEAICFPCLNATKLQTTNITATVAQLNWTAAANPVQWQVQYKTTRLGSKWVDVLVTGNKRSVIISGLLSNQNYQWQIRARCGTIWTAYSAAVGFITLRSTVIVSIALPKKVQTSATEPAGLKVSPNPSSGFINIDLQVGKSSSSTAVLSLLDLSGRRLYTEKTGIINGMLRKRMQLPWNVAAGSYILEVLVNNTSYTSKLVLIR